MGSDFYCFCFFYVAGPRRDIFFQKKQANPFLVPVAKFFISTHPRRDIFFHLNSPPEGYLLSKKSSQNPFLVAVADFVNFAK
jgi:hypothetical protein